MLIIGGDLAYPNPSNETYETRFFRPYEAALPMPPHVHPGRLVVTKPDLPLPHACGRSQPCSRPPSGCSAHSDLDGSPHTGEPTCRSICLFVLSCRSPMEQKEL